MSRGINKVILVGNVGKDPEVRYAANGNAVANVSIATTEEWNDRDSGQKQSKTEWHRVVFFGKLAEVVAQYVKKGSQLYVEGKLQTRKWTDQNGQDRYSTEVVVDQRGVMQMLGGGNSANNQQGMPAQQPMAQPQAQAQPQPQAQQPMAQPQAQPQPQQPMAQPQAGAFNAPPPPASAFDDTDVPF